MPTIKDFFATKAPVPPPAEIVDEVYRGLSSAPRPVKRRWQEQRELTGRVNAAASLRAEALWMLQHQQVGAARSLSRTAPSPICCLEVNQSTGHVAVVDDHGGCVVHGQQELTERSRKMRRQGHQQRHGLGALQAGSELSPQWQIPVGVDVGCVGWSHRNASVLAVAHHSSPEVRLFNINSKTQRPVCVLKAACPGMGGPFSTSCGGVCALEFVAGGPYSLAVANRLGKVLLWGKNPGQMPHGTLSAPKEAGSLQALETSSDGLLVYAASFTGMLLVWDVRKAGGSCARQFSSGGPDKAGLLAVYDMHHLTTTARSMATEAAAINLTSELQMDITSLHQLPGDPSQVLVVTARGGLLVVDICAGLVTHSCWGWMGVGSLGLPPLGNRKGCWAGDGGLGRSCTFLMPYTRSRVLPPDLSDPTATIQLEVTSGIAAVNLDQSHSPFHLGGGKPWLDMHTTHTRANTLSPPGHTNSDSDGIASQANTNTASTAETWATRVSVEPGNALVSRVLEGLGSGIDRGRGEADGVVVPWLEVSQFPRCVAVNNAHGMVLTGTAVGDLICLQA